MAIAFDAASSSGGAAVTSVTWSHTTSGANRALIVGVSFWNGSTQSISGVTYAGTAMTNVGGATDLSNDRAQQWALSNPTTGANNVVVSFSAAVDAVCGAVSFTGAHQTTASLTGTQATATGTSTAPSVNVTSATGEIVIDTLAQFAQTDTVGAGQTQRWNATFGSEDGAGSTEAGAATVTMSWTLGASADWALVGVGVKPAPVGTTVEPFPGRLLFQGQVPTVRDIAFTVPTPGLFQFQGQVPTVRDIAFTTPTRGLFQFKGYVPTTAKVKQPAVGKLLYVGQTPTLRSISFTNPTAGKFWFVGGVPGVHRSISTADPTAGKFQFVGGIPRADSGRTISPFAQVFSLVGFQPTVTPFYWNGSGSASSGWSAVSATAATWSAVSAGSTTWSTTATVSQSWSTISNISSTWSPL